MCEGVKLRVCRAKGKTNICLNASATSVPERENTQEDLRTGTNDPDPALLPRSQQHGAGAPVGLIQGLIL